MPYAPALIRRIAEVTGLGSHHRVLDLGCGPGLLARSFAPLAREVVAMDRSAEMLTAARALARGTLNIRFLAGSSYDLGPALGDFHLVVMGRSFHWMDRVDTLNRLDRMIEPSGAVALFHDSAPAVPANAWRKVWHNIREHYEPDVEPHRRDPTWVRHEAILLNSPFAHIESFGVIERRALDVETLVQRTLSLHFALTHRREDSSNGRGDPRRVRRLARGSSRNLRPRCVAIGFSMAALPLDCV